VRRMIKVLAVATLMTVILVASISPAIARPAKFGHNLHDNPSCDATTKAQNEYGAHHEVNPSADPPVLPGCWVVLPD
jgi:hypothetical protein